MRVNSIDDKTSFQSKGSLKKMLKLPVLNSATKDVNNLTSRLVDVFYKSKNDLGDFSFTQNNKTALTKAKSELGEYLHVTPQIEESALDETIKIPSRDIVKLFDIISENMKKPISKLVSKFDKIPTISKALDNIKILNLSNANRDLNFNDIFRMVSGLPVEKNASLISLRQTVAETKETAAELINPAKKEIAENFAEVFDNKNYATVKNEIMSLFKLLKGTKSNEDLAIVVEQIQKIIATFNG